MFEKREKNPNTYLEDDGELTRILILISMIGTVTGTILFVLIPELLTENYMVKRSCNYNQHRGLSMDQYYPQFTMSSY